MKIGIIGGSHVTKNWRGTPQRGLFGLRVSVLVLKSRVRSAIITRVGFMSGWSYVLSPSVREILSVEV